MLMLEQKCLVLLDVPKKIENGLKYFLQVIVLRENIHEHNID